MHQIIYEQIDYVDTLQQPFAPPLIRCRHQQKIHNEGDESYGVSQFIEIAIEDVDTPSIEPIAHGEKWHYRHDTVLGSVTTLKSFLVGQSQQQAVAQDDEPMEMREEVCP